eukprot:gene26551-biopygen16834
MEAEYQQEGWPQHVWWNPACLSQMRYSWHHHFFPARSEGIFSAEQHDQ